MGIFAGPGVIEDGLVLALDAANTKGYDKFENLLRYSEDFSNNSWIKQNGFSITSNTAIAPDGTLTADTASRVNLGAEYLYQTYGGAGTFTLSCWVRAVTGTTTFVMSSYNGVDGSIGSQTFTATTTWQRFSHTATVTTTNGWYPCIPSVSGAQLYIWGAQLERGSSVTDYYATTSAAKTRGTTWTDLSIGGGNNGTLDNSVTFTSNNGGGFSFDGTDEIISLPKIITTNDFTICQFISYTSDTGEGWTFEQYDYGAGRLVLNTGSNKFRFFLGGNAVNSSTTLVSGQKYFICCSRSGSSGSIYINGNLDATGTLNSNSIDNITSAIGGSRAFSSAKQFIGDIYTTSVYNRALTATEIQKNFNAQRGRFGI